MDPNAVRPAPHWGAGLDCEGRHLNLHVLRVGVRVNVPTSSIGQKSAYHDKARHAA